MSTEAAIHNEPETILLILTLRPSRVATTVSIEEPLAQPSLIPSVQDMLDTRVDVATIECYGYPPPHSLERLDTASLGNLLQMAGVNIPRLIVNRSKSKRRLESDFRCHLLARKDF